MPPGSGTGYKASVHTVHIPMELTGGEECQQKRQARAQTHTELHVVTDRGQQAPAATRWDLLTFLRPEGCT